MGKITYVGVAGAHDVSRVADKNMAVTNLFKDMGVILPVDNAPQKQKGRAPLSARVLL